MPGVTLEDPFPIARFHNAIPVAGAVKNVAVNINAATPSVDTDLTDRSDQLVISVQSEGIKLYNTGDQKCLKSWMIPPGIILAQPAIHRSNDTIDYTFALVASGTDITAKEGNKIVWMWKAAKEDNSTDNRVAKTFDDRIQSLHVSPALPSHLILVNENGSIALTTNDLDRTIAKTTNASSGTTIWSTVFVTTNPNVRPCCVSNSLVPVNSTIVLTINAAPKSSDKYTINLYYCNEERRSIDQMVKIDFILKEKPVDFTFDATDGRISVLGSAGTWSVWRMQLRHTTGHKVIGDIDAHLSMHLKGYQLSSDNLGKVASIALLDDSYVALVAPRIKTGGDGPEHVVSIWDMKYGTLQAERTIQLGDKNAYGKDKCIYKIQVLPNQQQLAISVSSVTAGTKNQTKAKGKAMVDVKSVVVLCSYYNEPISLMAAMGKMNSTIAFLGDEDALGLSRSGYDAVTHPTNFKYAEHKLYEHWIEALEKTQTSETDLLTSLLRPTLSVEEFTSVFFDAVLGSSKSQMERLQNNRYTKVMSQAAWKTETIEMSFHFVSCIIKKCFETSAFWPIEVFLYLLVNGKVRDSYVECGIVPALLERDDWDLVMVVLEHVPDIPESALVTLLSAFIEKRETGTLPEHHVATFFSKLLGSPHNDIFLQQALKRLTASELPRVLDLILDQLKYFREHGAKGKLLKLIEFANGVLDSHYPVIILEPSMYGTITALQELVEQEASVAEDVERIKAMLGPFERKYRKLTAERHIRKKSDGPPRQKSSSNQGIPVYRVEIFQF